MTDRVRAALPYVQARAPSTRHTWSCRAVIGGHMDRGLPSTSACSPRCTRAAVAACPSPLSAPRAHRLWVFTNRRFRLRITAGFTYDKCSVYLWAIAAWHVDNFGPLFTHRMWIASSQVAALLCVSPGN